MDEQLIILKKFPLLIPQNDKFTVYEGYIAAGKEEFLVSLRVPKYPLLEELSINLPWNVEVCMENNNRGIQKWLSNCTSLLTFLECLQSEVEDSLKCDLAKMLFRSGNRMPVEFYENFIDSISSIETRNIHSVSTNLEVVQLTVHDTCRNCHQHQLTVRYNIDEPNFPFIHAELPEIGIRKLEMGKDKGLIDVFKAFKETVLAFSDFWDVMDELDDKCWIILPEQPRRSDTFRRIALGHHVSLVVTLNPLCTQKVPELNFFGPEHYVQSLVNTMQENAAHWPEGQSFVDSLQLLLGVDVFPSNPDKEVENCESATDMECMICYSVLLAGETPTEACGNKCGAVYHVNCISQWLIAIASCNDSFMTTQGKCPSCNIGIVKVSNVKQ